MCADLIVEGNELCGVGTDVPALDLGIVDKALARQREQLHELLKLLGLPEEVYEETGPERRDTMSGHIENHLADCLARVREMDSMILRATGELRAVRILTGPHPNMHVHDITAEAVPV